MFFLNNFKKIRYKKFSKLDREFSRQKAHIDGEPDLKKEDKGDLLNENSYNIEESISIDYDYYNEIANSFKKQFDVDNYEDWDYLTFTDENFSNEEEDDDYASYDELFEDLVNYFYEESMKELDFSDLFGEEWLQISVSNAEQLLSDIIFDKKNAYSTAIKFLCNYILCEEKIDFEISSLVSSICSFSFLSTSS